MFVGHSRNTIAAGLLLFAVGCHAPMNRAAFPSFDDATGQAIKMKQSVAVVVIDPHRGKEDAETLSAFRSAMKGRTDVAPALVDLSASKNRAVAAPLHAVDKPTVICLSPAGIGLTRDEAPVTVEQIRARLDAAKGLGERADGEYAKLKAAVAAAPSDVSARLALADFLLAHHNEELAIEHLRVVADNASVAPDVRIKTWVALGRAHLWIIEPEKARHCAQDLIEKLGPIEPTAVAGGNLIRGLQDTRAKRYDRARTELEAAVKAAPDSPYGREAAGLLTKLPSGK